MKRLIKILPVSLLMAIILAASPGSFVNALANIDSGWSKEA